MGTQPDIRRIFVLTTNNQLGDVLCSVPLFAALKQTYPGSHVTLAASPASYPLDLKTLIPSVDEIFFHPFRLRRPRDLLQCARRLRAGRFDVGIVPSTFKVSSNCHLIAYLSGAPVRVGVGRVDGIRNPYGFLLNARGDFQWKHVHQIQRHLDIAGLAGCRSTVEDAAGTGIGTSASDADEARRFLAACFPDRSRAIVGLHVGAGEPPRVWPADRFTALAKRLFECARCQFLFTVGPLDEAIVGGIRSALAADGIASRVFREEGLGRLAAVLKQIDLYVTNNSGAMHVAHFAQALMVAMTPSEYVETWCYQSERERTLHAAAIDDITVDQVFDACVNMIRTRRMDT